MKQFFKSDALSVGLAMFSMFFGAGNVIFPLAVGQYAGDKGPWAIFGLLITAVIVPIAGVMGMILFNGDTRAFFGRLGRLPGLILATVIISLLGPLGSTPRCIVLAYTTLQSALGGVSPLLFSLLACAIIFAFTVRRTHLLKLLGWVLTPILLASLAVIIIMGLLTAKDVQIVDQSQLAVFFHGLKEGYNTMDLLAAFFFSATILNALKQRATGNPLQTAMRASIVGAALLAITYIGFSTLAAFHGHDLTTIGKDELLAAITLRIAGPAAGLLVCVTVALACLTTAIALISAFTEFVHKELFKERTNYTLLLICSLLITFVVSSFRFTGISAFLGPVLEICYPVLIALTLWNIAYRIKRAGDQSG